MVTVTVAPALSPVDMLTTLEGTAAHGAHLVSEETKAREG